MREHLAEVAIHGRDHTDASQQFRTNSQLCKALPVVTGPGGVLSPSERRRSSCFGWGTARHFSEDELFPTPALA